MSGGPEPSQASQPPGAAAGHGLFASVAARAEATPDEPALFFPDGLDVRWRSWGELAGQAAAGAAALTGLDLPPGAPVAYRWRPHPDAVAADLAVQAAGSTAVPLGEEDGGTPAGCGARLLLPGEPEPGDGIPVAVLPAPPARGSRSGSGPEELPVRAAPGAVRAGGATMPPGELLDRARSLGRRLERAAAGLGALRPRRPLPREIALASFDLRTLDGRVVLAWALDSGAALFLEPDPRAAPGAAAWARPSLIAGDARTLTTLARQVLKPRGRERAGPVRKLLRLLGRADRRPPRPFGRLRLLVLLGDGRLPLDDLVGWAERGVAVVRAGEDGPAEPR
ncbi:MAG: AMP-binding protein [Thermoanaerobaculia bacterium]